MKKGVGRAVFSQIVQVSYYWRHPLCSNSLAPSKVFRFRRLTFKGTVSRNLPPVALTPVANLPPASTTLAKMVEKFATGVVDTGGEFAKNFETVQTVYSTLTLGGN
jgi:hypothetical protein